MRNVIFKIEKVICIDFKNFIFVVNNGVEENVIVMVELIVKCEYDIYF